VILAQPFRTGRRLCEEFFWDPDGADDTDGEVLSSAGSGASSFGFTGELVDASGLLYLRARYYAPWDSRFLTRDAWDGDYNMPMSYNPWLYAYANPILLTDPGGGIHIFPLLPEVIHRVDTFDLSWSASGAGAESCARLLTAACNVTIASENAMDTWMQIQRILWGKYSAYLEQV